MAPKADTSPIPSGRVPEWGAASGTFALAACAGFMLGSGLVDRARRGRRCAGGLQLLRRRRVGKRIAIGGTSIEVGCTGAPQTVLVRVFANQVAFSKTRAALVQGSIYACNSEGCGQAVDSATIRIR